MSARRAANSTYSPDPAASSPESAPKVSSDVSATGPVCRYGDETKGAASSGGSAAANSPMWGGTPAISA